MLVMFLDLILDQEKKVMKDIYRENWQNLNTDYGLGNSFVSILNFLILLKIL